MVGVLAVVLIVAFIIWLVSAFAPQIPAWGNRVALAIVLGCLILIALGVGVECRGGSC